MENIEHDILYQIALLEIDQVGNTVARNLIDEFGSAEAVFKATKKELSAFGALSTHLINGTQDRNNLSFAEAQLKFADQNGSQVLSYYEKAYPNRLKHCNDAPLVLYKKGNTDLNHQRMVAIVGTRQCTQYGKDFCESLVQELQNYGAHVISGLAFGIDACAHQFAVQNGLHNIAVMAHGLDRVYPAEHRNLAFSIADKGALLTEYPINTRPDRENFPQRNRIVAGMSDAIVVVESAIKGGSIITAKLGNDFNRDVFAVPGRIHDAQSAGCNHLIKTNQAHLLQGTKDIAYLLGWNKETQKKNSAIQKQLFVDLNEQEAQLVKVLQDGEKSIDEISVLANMAMSTVSTQLLMLELKGILKQAPGKRYQLT